MIKTIDGSRYAEFICNGIKNLERYKTVLNDLNVFPVPDGDTGTNMLMTLRYGYEAIKSYSGPLSETSRRFSSAAVFGARGNSGVIVSQFFKGLSEGFKDADEADSACFAAALQSGCKYAYDSVAKPVEGTMLTVLKDASLAVSRALPLEYIDDAIDIFLGEARKSLAHTPELLPILKKASVVDSGGSGIVYFFEGVQKHIKGEAITSAEESQSDAYIDLSRFNKDTQFKYGYCVEGLIQLKIDAKDFDHNKFKSALSERGDSIVSSLEGDKVKIHIHTKKPGLLMDYCQSFGEFLTVKIENMTVQNVQKEDEEKEAEEKEAEKFLYNPDADGQKFAVIAVATNAEMQKKFFEMGADVAILSEIAPSSQDFIDAFKLTRSKNILVFPNCANTILASMQAGSMYKDARVTVLNTRSLAECYAILTVLDFEDTVAAAVDLANDTLSGIYQYSIYHAVRDVKFGSRKIDKGNFFALEKNSILDVGDTLQAVALRTVSNTLKKYDCGVITLFYGKDISHEYIEDLADKISELDCDQEIATVPTYETVCDITITFE